MFGPSMRETLCTLRALVSSGCSPAWRCTQPEPRQVSIPRTRARRIPLLARWSYPGSISLLPELRRARYVLSESYRERGLDSPWRLTTIASPLLTTPATMSLTARRMDCPVVLQCTWSSPVSIFCGTTWKSRTKNSDGRSREVQGGDEGKISEKIDL